MNPVFWITFVYYGASSARAAVAANWTTESISSNFLGRRMQYTEKPLDLTERCNPGIHSVDAGHGICHAWKGCGTGADWQEATGEVFWWACGAKCKDGPYVLEDCSCACECTGSDCTSWSESDHTPSTPAPQTLQYQYEYEESPQQVRTTTVPPGSSSGQARQGLLVTVEILFLGFLLIMLSCLCCGLVAFCCRRKLSLVFPWEDSDDDEEAPKIHISPPTLSPPILSKQVNVSSRIERGKSTRGELEDTGSDAGSNFRDSSTDAGSISKESSRVHSRLSTPRSNSSMNLEAMQLHNLGGQLPGRSGGSSLPRSRSMSPRPTDVSRSMNSSRSSSKLQQQQQQPQAACGPALRGFINEKRWKHR